jgi:DNA-binding NarL/FixJ family response regulator
MLARVRTALVSNSPLVLAGLDDGLRRRGDFEIVLAADVARACASESLGAAQVCVVDVPTDTDPQAIAALGEHGAALVLLWPEREGPLGEWLLAGHSLLARGAPIAEIAIAAHAAAAGLVASSAALTAEALRAAAGGGGRPPPAPEPDPLTPRERQVLEKMSLGLGNREIAEALHISAHTAKFHVAQIIAKLEASSRAHAVAKAMRAGLVEI